MTNLTIYKTNFAKGSWQRRWVVPRSILDWGCSVWIWFCFSFLQQKEWVNERLATSQRVSEWDAVTTSCMHANPSYTFQRDHAQGVARREPLHVGKAARRLNQHRKRHFSCLLSSMSIALQKGQARIWQLSLASSYLSLEPPQPTLLMTVAVFFPCRKISIIRAAMKFDRSPHGGK